VADAGVLAQVDALQMRYLAALDRHDLAAWLDCFADEASYVCITRENHDDGLPVALMMDDCRARLRDRVKFVTEVWSGTFEDYATRHFVQRFDCAPGPDSTVTVRSNFMVSYTNRRGASDILVTGVYEDEIALGGDGGGGGAKFKSKRAILDTVTTPRYLVYPV
jgi:3-phenylpropionate/cinnamic acid dioxygenase small subunit